MLRRDHGLGISGFIALFLLMFFSSDLITQSDQNTFKSAHKLFEIGRKQFLKGKYKQAGIPLQKCLKKFPSHSWAWYYLGLIEYRERDFNNALDYILKAKKRFPDYHKVLTNLKLEQKNQNRIQKDNLKDVARELLHRLDFDNACGGKLIRRKYNQASRSISNFHNNKDGALENTVVIPALFYSKHGDICYQKGWYQEAVYQYKASIMVNPKNNSAYNNLSNIYALAKKHSEALYYLNMAENKKIKINSKFKKKMLELLEKQFALEDQSLLPLGIKRFEHPVGNEFDPLFQNTYLVFNPETKDALIIDPGVPDKQIELFAAKTDLKIRGILNTHGHFDHVSGNEFYSEKYGVKVWGPDADRGLYQKSEDKNKPDNFFKKDESLVLDSLHINCKSVPGHSPGSTCFIINGALFSGDTLFKGNIGAVDGLNQKAQFINMDQMIRGIKKQLLSLPENTPVLTGHGQPSTIGLEIKSNPYLNPIKAAGLFKRYFQNDRTIREIVGLNNNRYHVQVIFGTPGSHQDFLRNYGDKILGLNLLLTSN